MTWTKLSDSFADECARVGLSDAAVRTHIEGLIWAMRRESGGYLDSRDIRRAIETENAAVAIAELLAVGFWERRGTGYLITHHMEHQPEPDLLEKRRQNDAQRQRKRRRKLAGLEDVTP
jgi:hypothetical protein